MNRALEASDRRNQGRRSRSHRRFLINPRFQLTFLALMTGFAALSTAVAYGVSRHYLHEFERTALDLGLSIDHPLFELVKQQRSEMTFAFMGSAAAIWAVLLAGGLAASHWIAGPIYRMLTHMNRLSREGVTEATLHPVKFRRGDFFPELAQAYNRVLQKISHK